MVDVDVRTVSDGGLDKLGPCRNTDSEGKYFVGTFFKTLLVAAMSDSCARRNGAQQKCGSDQHSSPEPVKFSFEDIALRLRRK